MRGIYKDIGHQSAATLWHGSAPKAWQHSMATSTRRCRAASASSMQRPMIDLARIAALGKAAQGPVLWIGTGGLAQALAGNTPGQADEELPAPLLGLFGSDQAVTAGQLAACGADWVRLRDGGSPEAETLAAQMQANGRVMASLDLPAGLARDEAAQRIETELHRLVHALPPPGTLIVVGGETLRGLCLSLGAHKLEVQGRIVPGLPRSILRGGAWNGVTVVSKSGAFGHPTLLRDLGAAPSATERMV
jgi:uncharacterized protein YgbK (DUF1537 family)